MYRTQEQHDFGWGTLLFWAALIVSMLSPVAMS